MDLKEANRLQRNKTTRSPAGGSGETGGGEQDEDLVVVSEEEKTEHKTAEGDAPPPSAAADAAAAVMAAERSAARIERMGYDVGYRLCERLAQSRPLLGPGSPSPESGTMPGGGDASNNAGEESGADGGSTALAANAPLIMGECPPKRFIR